MPGPGDSPRPRRRATLEDFLRPTDGSEERRRRAFAGRPQLPLPQVVVGEPVMEPNPPEPDIVVGQPVMDEVIRLPEVRLGSPEPIRIKARPETLDRMADARQADETARTLDLEEQRDATSDLDTLYRQLRSGVLPSTPDMSTGDGGASLEDIYRAGLVERPGGAPAELPQPQVPGALSGLQERLDANRAAIRGVQSEMSAYQPTGATPTGDGSIPAPTRPTPPGIPVPARRGPVAARGGGLTPEDQAAVLEAANGALGGSASEPGKPSYDREMGLIGAGEDIARQRAESVAQGARDRVTALDAAQQQREELNRRRQDALGTARMRFEQANREAAAMRIDPQHWWSDRGFAGGVAASIAMALGSFAEALGAGPNRAAEMIQNAIQRDVESQRLNAAIARQGADGARSAYYMTRNQFQDADAAQAAAEALMLAQVQADVDRRGAEIGTQEAKVNAEALRLELEGARQQAQARAEQAEADRALQQARTMSQIDLNMARADQARRRGRGGGGAGGPGASASGLGRPMTIQQMQAADEEVRRLEANGHSHDESVAAVAQQYGVHPSVIAGGGGAYLSPQQRQTVAQTSDALDRLEALMGPEGQNVEGVGPIDRRTTAVLGPFAPERARQTQQAVRAVELAYAQLVSGLAYTDTQLEGIMEVIRGAGTDEDLRHGVSLMRSRLNAMANGRVAQPQGGAQGQQRATTDGFEPED